MIEAEKKEQPTKTKLGFRVLVKVVIGISIVFGLMFFINRVISYNISDLKVAYYFSILASNILFVILILAVKGRELSWADLGFRKIRFLTGLKEVLKVWAITWLINLLYLITVLNTVFNKPYNHLPENPLLELLQNPTVQMFILNLIIIALAVPVIEETLFRGLLFGSFKTYFGVWTAVTLSAIIFSALHFDLFGFFPRLVLGVGLGYLYVKNNSILPSIGLHGLNNFFAVLMISLFA